MFNVEDILENIKTKYGSGKYIKFNVKINWSVDCIPTIEYDTEEMPNKIEIKQMADNLTDSGRKRDLEGKLR